MLVIKDLYSDISDCFWLFYGSKYSYCLFLITFMEVVWKELRLKKLQEY